MPDVNPDQFSGCQSPINVKRATGVRGRGTQGYTVTPAICGGAVEGDTGMCAKHNAAAAKMKQQLAKKQAWEAANPGIRWRG